MPFALLGMSIEDKIIHLLEDGEARATALRWVWWLSVAFLIFGYGAIAYYLFW